MRVEDLAEVVHDLGQVSGSPPGEHGAKIRNVHFGVGGFAEAEVVCGRFGCMIVCSNELATSLDSTRLRQRTWLAGRCTQASKVSAHDPVMVRAGARLALRADADLFRELKNK
jgi:hypothetical protein